MPVYRLSRALAFPPVEHAGEDGLLAVGGNLSVRRLVLAYSLGIFPWFSEGPILWWSPDPRLVLFPEELVISRSLRQTMEKGTFEATFDKAFGRVVRLCAGVRDRADGGTWITGETIDAYIALHRAGHAHSVEAWKDGALAGGLYGVSLGRAFFGESMFTLVPDASKVAFVRLVEALGRWGFSLIDCQVRTQHLMRFGAREIPRRKFLGLLGLALRDPSRSKRWASSAGSVSRGK